MGRANGEWTVLSLLVLLNSAHAGSLDYELGGTLYVQVYKDPTTVAAALSRKTQSMTMMT